MGIKENASKATKFMQSLILSADQSDKPPKELYAKHDKIRIFVPKKEMIAMIANEIKISNEWWDALRLNHIIFKTTDADLWRSCALNNGWFNAFGTIKVKRGEIKRWNVKIFERN